MKTRWLLLTALCILFARSAIAQNDFTQKLTGNVPFDFVVNGTTLPRGEYVVSATSDGLKLLIQNKSEARYATFVLSKDVPLDPYKAPSQAKMVFVRTNGQHVLHQISIEDANHADDIIHGSDVIELVTTR